MWVVARAIDVCSNRCFRPLSLKSRNRCWFKVVPGDWPHHGRWLLAPQEISAGAVGNAAIMVDTIRLRSKQPGMLVEG